MDSVSETKGIPDPESAANACDRDPHESPWTWHVGKQDATSDSYDHENSSGCEENVCRRFDAGRHVGPRLSSMLDEPRHNDEVHYDCENEGVWIKFDVHRSDAQQGIGGAFCSPSDFLVLILFLEKIFARSNSQTEHRYFILQQTWQNYFDFALEQNFNPA
jgi:hypothetical protein